MTKPCKACEGKGKLGLFLGAPDEPCKKCAGTGVIEVVEEPLTPWQQEVSNLLRQILSCVQPQVARDEAEDRSL